MPTLNLSDEQPTRTLETRSRAANGGGLATFPGDEEVRQPPFDAITFSLKVLWP
jgi:hypothetical protein